MATLRSLADRFEYSLLIGQFLLSRRDVLDEWRHEQLSDWHLSIEPGLPYRRAFHGDRWVGWLIGTATDRIGQPIDGDFVMAAGPIDSSIESLGGRFALILPGLERVYLDACGLLSAVYCETREAVASTASLLSYAGNPDRDAMIAAMGIPDRNAMFPVGMSPREGIDRLLPNHYLDLGSWRSVRYWPRGALDPVDDVSEAVSEIAGICERQIQGALHRGGAAVRLTGGRDSRMLIACAREQVEDLECVTADLRDDESMVDCTLARRISRTARVPHRILPWIPPDERDLSLWVFRAGLGTWERRGWLATTLYRVGLDASKADVLGVGGELARGMWWRSDDSEDSRIAVGRLMEHAKCPDLPETRQYLEAWLSSVPELDALQMLDLFYLEQRIGCWAGVVAYAEAGYSREQVFPMAHRRVMELMMRLPAHYRRSGRLAEDVIALRWPELLSLPFNSPAAMDRLKMTVRHLGRRAGRLLNDPVGVARRRLGR